VPSAGSRHALETWLVINNVSGLQPGLYRYIATKRQLALIAPASDGDIAAKAIELCHGQPFVKTAAALFIWVAVPYRMTWRYGDRGYRYLHLDAGHVCQNLYLAAESIDAGVCAIAAYDDDQMNAFLGIDGENAFAIYMATVGKK
jgi:SagB-type dehydrogenase family enzyme